MSAWPTLREWFQFGGTLALELTFLFALARLVALRVRSAQGRRALWQITLLAMLLVTVGELNGVRGWMRRPEKTISTPAQTKLVVTLKDVEPNLDLLREQMMAETSAALPTQPAPRPSLWQQRVVWPALLWAACAALVLLRLLFAQVMAAVVRLCGRPGAPVAALIERAQHLAGAMGIHRKVVLFTSARTVAPFTFGAWRPVIVLPQHFSTTFTPEQQDAALAHELAHVAGFDSAWRCFSQFVCAVLWWHPLAWLTKRELDHASELVADEASLLVANGPDRLAECLLACAKQLRRSALGRRVARLLELPPHARLSRPVPWYLRLIAPALCAVLVWAGMALAMKSGEPRGGAWRASILGSAFAAAEPAKTNRVEAARPDLHAALRLEADPNWTPGANTNATNRFTSVKRQAIYEKLQRIRLSEWGPIDSQPLSEVLQSLSAEARRLDPEHTGVNFIISSTPPGPAVERVDAAGLPVSQPTFDPNSVLIRLGTKLPELTLENVLMILEKIADQKIRYTVEDFGVVISPKPTEPATLHTRFFKVGAGALEQRFRDIHTSSTNPVPNQAAAGGGATTNQGGGIPFGSVPTAAETAIPRFQKLFASAGVDLTAPGKSMFWNDRLGVLMVRATLDDLAVIEKGLKQLGFEWTPGVLPQAEPLLKTNAPTTAEAQLTNSPELPTRIFRVDLNTFERELDSVSVPDLKSGRSQPVFDATSRTNALLIKLQTFLKKAGVDLSAPGKSIFYSDRLGMLMVRATAQDLDAMEKAIQMLNMQLPQLEIRVQAVEVSAAAARQTFLQFGITNSPPSQKYVSGVTNRPGPALTGILTEKQFRAVTNALAKGGGTDLLSAPTITTLSGRQAQIKVVDIRYIVTGLDWKTNTTPSQTGSVGVGVGGLVTPGVIPVAEPFELGPVIDVIPYVQPDGYTIQMTVLPTIKEFLGYDEEKHTWATGGPYATSGLETLSSPTPLPKFRLRQIASTAMVWDGQTLVLGTGDARDTQIQRWRDGTNKWVTTNFTDKALFYFITPRIIDAAGNPMHTDEELPFAQKGVPGQKRP